MTLDLQRLIAEASVLAGGKHQCAVLGHLWRSIGGRACPYASEELFRPNCSQTVYECTSCGDIDYGDPGGPGHRDCIEQGPCSPDCQEAKDRLERRAA